VKTSILLAVASLVVLTPGLGQTFTLKSSDIGGQATEKQVV